ncbi:MAG TPA: SpoIIE family protein phosphatase, partial [Methanotrichaceae archaeon]|nr:SpoIIE family protein phosphatase [Methanotrichaceae archaeon]
REELEKSYGSFNREGDDTIVVETFNSMIKGGEGAYLWAKALPLRDSSGVVIGAIETIRDITKRKLAEQALRKSEREKEAILGGLRKVAVEYLDDHMRIIWINEPLQTRLGLSMDQLRGKYCYEAIQGLNSPCPGCKVIETLRTGDAQEGELITPDGRAWEARSNPIKDDSGRITGVVQVAMNITERKRAEQKMADIINFLPDATFVIDTDGKVIAWNRAMEGLTGIQAPQILGKGDCEYALPIYGSRRRMLIDLVLRSDELLEGKYDTVNREGNTIITEVFVPSFKPGGAYLWAKASPLYEPNGKLIGAIETIRDVTERRQIEQKLERSKAELQIAAEIQKNFLPDHTPTVFQFKLAAVTIPAMEVGGDFYDFISLPDGKQGLVIADVAGKSIPAALFMALSRTIVRANAAHQPQTAEVLREANNMIAEDASAGMFVTLFYGILDGKAHTLTYANAGHPPLLVFRTGGCRCTEQEVTGVALGAMDGMEYEERQVQFMPGDVAVLYTDGVTEAVNNKGEMYGLKRLCSVMTKNGHLSAQVIMEKVLDDISEFSGDQSQYDDITLVVMKAE